MSRYSTIATNALAALAVGVLQLGLAISLAALIFSGPLSDGAGRAATGFVLGTAFISAIVGATSKMTVSIAGTQDTAAIVAVAVATSIVASPDISVDERLPTVFVMIALSTVASGVMFWIIGRFGLSGFVRFLPYPVVSGFMAGTGWLLLRGGIEVMHRKPVEWSSASDLVTWTEFKFLLPGLLLALLMLVVLSTPITNTLISIAILAGTALFHLVGRSVSDIASIESAGWLVGPFVDQSGWAPIGPDDFTNADWGVLGSHTLPIVTIVAVSIIGMLLNLSGLETGPDARIDMNRELRSAGIANVLAGAGSGLIGYHLLGDTVLGRQLGARGRAVPLTIALMAVVTFVLGPDLIGMVPRGVAGGVLAGLGINLLRSWVRESMPRMNSGDRVLSALILASIATLGVLPGVAAGVLIAAAVFVFKYSRIDPVRHILDAAGRSNVDRPEHHRRHLMQSSGSILAFELQGFLFFGSTTRLRAEIDDEVASHGESGGTRFVIMDFGHVTGVDSTASTGLGAIATQLFSQGITPLWSGIKQDLVEDLERDGVISASDHRDLDHAIAWCEDELVRSQAVASTNGADSDAVLAPELVAVMQKRHLDVDETLIENGASDRDLYFVESGRLSAWIVTDDGRSARIRQVLPGAALGEIAFCTGGVRTATVIADTEAVVYVLRREHFDELVATQPHVAIAIQDDLLQRMGQRVSSTSAMVRDLLR